MQRNNVPKLRFKEFGDEWTERSFSDLGTTYNGLTGKNGDDFGEGLPYITYKQIFDDSKINLSKCGLVRVAPSENQKKVKQGDIFFTTSSETPNEVGVSSVLLDSPEEVYLNSFCFGFRLEDPESISSVYLGYLLSGPQFRRKMIRLAQGSTRYNISKSGFNKLEIVTPGAKEQRKVAGYLTSVDEKISKLEQKKAEFEKYKEGVIQQIFSRKIRFKKPDGLSYPDWEVKKLEDVITSVTTGLNPRDNFVLGNGSNKYISIKNIKSGKIDFKNCDYVDDKALEKINKRSRLNGGDIIFASIGNIGNSYLLENDPVGWDINESVFSIKSNKGIVDQKYLYQYINTGLAKKYFKKFETGSSFTSIKIGDLKNLLTIVPSKDEQQKVADFLSNLDNKIELINKELQGTKKFKKALLQQMFV